MIWFESVLAATLVLVTDQASKAVVLRTRPQPSNFKRQFVSIRPALNRGGALASFSPLTLLLVWGAAVVLVMFALYSGDALYRGRLVSVGFGVALGGATGNMLDRMRQGAIIDFIAIGSWPLFNLADVAIVLGIGLVLLAMGWATNAQDPF